ncbi:MAG: branched-chain amino acid ABC transporter permease [Reyranellaceae bacterium]
MLETIAEFLVLGIVIGGIYALIAVGVTLIFGVLDIINVAHGEFFAIGGYLVVLAMVLLGLGPVVGVVAAVVGCFVLGLAIYPLLIAPLKAHLGRRPAGPLYLVLTLGLSIFLQNVLLAVFGGEYLQVPPFVGGMVDLDFTLVSYHRVLILVVATAALGALFLFLRYHREGLALRAVAQNPDAAQSVGINLPRTFALTIAISVALAGLAGGLLAPLVTVYPSVGFQLTIKAFAITILGGMGNVVGALVAAFVLSITEAMAGLVLPSEWQGMIAFAVMILVLLVRPEGLAGKRGRRT